MCKKYIFYTYNIEDPYYYMIIERPSIFENDPKNKISKESIALRSAWFQRGPNQIPESRDSRKYHGTKRNNNS